MRKTLLVLSAVLGLLTFAGGEVRAATCIRCFRRDRNWFAWCPRCRTIYCNSCSSESRREIRKRTYSNCTLTCPNCGYSKCRKLRVR